MTGFWICVRLQLWKASEYSRILSILGFCILQVLHKVLNMPEYDWIMLYGRVWIWLANVSHGFTEASSSKYVRAQNMGRLWICKGYTWCWISLNMPGCGTGHLINISSKTQEKEVPSGNILDFFSPGYSQNCIWNGQFKPVMDTIRAFLSKIKTLFSIFKKSRGGLPSPL